MGQANPGMVLVVDDDSSYREALTRSLSSLGYQPFAAESVEEAIRLLRIFAIDVILLDLVMPGYGGEELLKALQRAGSSIAVIVVSGSPEAPRVIAEAAARSPVELIRKPFSLDQLAAALARALSSS